MSVHVEEMSSEVIPEPEPLEGGAASGGSSWVDEDRFLATEQRIRVDRARTRAEGFDA